MIYTFEETITRVLRLIRKSSFITLIEVDDKVRLGMYYIMKIYGLGFRQCVRASWEWIELCKDDGPALNADEILEMTPNMETYNELRRDHNAGKLPNIVNESKVAQSSKDVPTGFGWLSPTGVFVESDWGHHLESAINLIEEYDWEGEYEEWVGDRYDDMCPENDFLCEVKGYVLIHNPSMDGGYIVTNRKPFTKKQREFLFDYFMALGNRGRAEMYLTGQEV